MRFSRLNSDQRREIVNTQQRFEALREAELRSRGYRGSMTWSRTNGRDYLLRSAYDKHGRRRQTSLGPRSAETEALKAEFEAARATAGARLESLEAVMVRQASVNRALRLGRMPVETASILRALDRHGVLDGKLRVLGSNALYAYEAASDLRLDAEYMETGDCDFLLDARARLSLAMDAEPEGLSFLNILRRVDRSFERMAQTFRAVNRDGFMVDLVMPMRDPPWAQGGADRIGGDPDDLVAVEIDGLAWHQSAPTFEAIVIDARGDPVRVVTSDPRIFAAHKLWMSQRDDREPIKRARDADQASVVGALVATEMPHLPFARAELRMLPKPVFDAAAKLFVSG